MHEWPRCVLRSRPCRIDGLADLQADLNAGLQEATAEQEAAVQEVADTAGTRGSVQQPSEVPKVRACCGPTQAQRFVLCPYTPMVSQRARQAWSHP